MTSPDVNLDVTISRAEFERKICEPLKRRLMEPLITALEDAGENPENIAQVIIVGGSSNIPYVKNILR